jgi:DNA-binding HxlR family transcriptional regulator
MPRKRYGQACPVAKSLELVGERWTLLIVRDLLGGAQKFQDLEASLPGIAPALLSERLKRLEAHGLVTRRFYSEHPPRAEYLLTDRGRELGVVIGALATWGSRHLHPQSALVHADCGHEVTLRYFCPECDARVPGGSVTLRRGRHGRGSSRAAAARPAGAAAGTFARPRAPTRSR